MQNADNSALEENAVTLHANLRKMDDRRRRIGNELKAVSRAYRCGGGNRDGYPGHLEKISGKLLNRITEAGEALDDVAPLDIHGIDHPAGKTHWARGIQAVWNREGIKHGADVVRLQPGRASGQVHGSATGRQRRRPKNEALGDSSIPRMKTERTAR